MPQGKRWRGLCAALCAVTGNGVVECMNGALAGCCRVVYGMDCRVTVCLPAPLPLPLPLPAGVRQPAEPHGARAQRGADAARRAAIPGGCPHAAADVGCVRACVGGWHGWVGCWSGQVVVRCAALLGHIFVACCCIASHPGLHAPLLPCHPVAADAVPAFNIFGLQRLFSDLGGIR